LGRLHAFERLTDIVCDAAGTEAVASAAARVLKKQGFLKILDTEEPHLPTCANMIARFRAALSSDETR